MATTSPESPDTDPCSCSGRTPHPPTAECAAGGHESNKREFYESHRKRRLDVHAHEFKDSSKMGSEGGGGEAQEMLPTPSTSHVNYKHVYEPAEDSFLLLDTISSVPERAFLHSRFPVTSPSPLIVELGTGSGVVLAFAAAQSKHIFGRLDVLTLGCDINQFACRATAETVRLAIQEANANRESAQFLGSVNADLTAAIKPGSVDVLIFNPPYVPTEFLPDGTNNDEFADRDDFKSSEEFERNSYLLALSYAGGVDGMEVTNRILSQLPTVLSHRGMAYILLCTQNKPEAVKQCIRTWPGGWAAETVGLSGKTAGWEKLSILRIWRP